MGLVVIQTIHLFAVATEKRIVTLARLKHMASYPIQQVNVRDRNIEFFIKRRFVALLKN